MYTNSLNQLSSFIIFIIVGGTISIIFDIFRVLRKTFKTPDFLTYFEDICFWIISVALIIISTFLFNNGELRLYIFIGLFLGSLIYILFISKYFIKLSMILINIVKKLIHILTIPINFLQKILKNLFIKPISFIVINFRKIFDKKLDKNEGI